jgi:formylglycine-generating enzyme required for sulfatase activity
MLLDARTRLLGQLETRAIGSQTVSPPNFVPPRGTARFESIVVADSRAIAPSRTLSRGTTAGVTTIAAVVKEVPFPVSRLRSQLRLFPPSAASESDELAATAERQLLATLDLAPTNLSEAEPLLKSYAALFPAQAAAFQNALAVAFAERIGLALAEPSIESNVLFEPLGRFAEIFPDANVMMRRRGADALRTRLESAAKNGAALAESEREIRAYRDLFPEHLPSISATLSPLLIKNVVARARQKPGEVVLLRDDVELLRELLPEARQALDTQLSRVLIDGIVAQIKSDSGLGNLLPTAGAFAQLLPEAAVTLRQRIAPAALESLLSLAKGDPTLATLELPLSRYRQAFPDADLTRLVTASTTSVAMLLTDLATATFARVRSAQGQFRQLFSSRAAELDVVLSRRVEELLRSRAAAAASNIQTLVEPVRLTRELLGVSANDVLRKVAEDVAAALGNAYEGGTALTDLGSSVTGYRELFAEHESALVAALGKPAADAIATRAADAPKALETVSASVQIYRQMFPQQSAFLDERLMSRVVNALRTGAALAAADPGAFSDSVALLKQWLPAADSALDSVVAPVFEDGVERATRAQPLQFAVLATRLRAFTQMFPARSERLSERTAVIVGSALQSKYQGGSFELTAVRNDVSKFTTIYAQQADALRARLAPTVADNVLSAVAKAPTDMAVAATMAREFGELFPRASVISPEIAQVIWSAVEALARTVAGDTVALAKPLSDFRRLFPAEFTRRGTGLAEQLANDIERLTRESPRDLEGIRRRLDGFSTIFPDRAEPLRVRLAAPVIAKFAEVYRTTATSLEQVRTDQIAFGTVFPTQIDRFRSRVSGVLAEQAIRKMTKTPNDIAGGRALSDAFGAVFPEQAKVLRADLAQALWGQVAAEADARPGDLLAIADTLREFRVSFADEYERFSASLALRIARSLQNQVGDPASKLDVVANRLEQFRALFPAQHGEVASEVGAAFTERLTNAKLDTAEQVTRLGPALRELRGMFPERHRTLANTLAERLVARVQELSTKRPFLASDLRKSGLQLFPGNAGLSAIRIELPLAEVKDGLQLVSAGKLTAAAGKLAEALKLDTQHSTIPGLRTALENQQLAAEVAYAKYLRTVKTSRKPSEHQKAYKAARSLWSDNTKFKPVTPPAPNACTTTKAGLGQRHMCFDKIGPRKNDRGPIMVVVPTGSSVKEAFAIGKYEVSVHDYRQYCRASKACKPPRGKRTLPMHKISLSQIEAYAAWLSSKAKVSYRLPTATEWAHAANADGAQPKRDYNCTVTVGAQQLKGLSLISVKSGNQNGWGLINYLGNVQELVREGASLKARGGSYKNKLNQCKIGLSVDHSGGADGVTGFRLVREVSR